MAEPSWNLTSAPPRTTGEKKMNPGKTRKTSLSFLRFPGNLAIPSHPMPSDPRQLQLRQLLRGSGHRLRQAACPTQADGRFCLGWTGPPKWGRWPLKSAPPPAAPPAPAPAPAPPPPPPPPLCFSRLTRALAACRPFAQRRPRPPASNSLKHVEGPLFGWLPSATAGEKATFFWGGPVLRNM